MPIGHHSHCLVCGSGRLTALKGYERHHLSRCAGCGLVFCLPIPTGQELAAVYEGYGRNDYLSPLTVRSYELLLDSFEPYRQTNRLIDVGCGIGYFLEVAKRRGWEVHGTEYTDEAVLICQQKGIAMRKGPLREEDYAPASFDIVCSFEVMEHINNPREEVALFHRLLRKGGLAYVTTPNFNALERRLLKADYNVLCYPEHLTYYTPRTLSRLFVSSGFKKRGIETTGISITRIRKSRGSSDQPTISATSDDEVLRGRIASNPLLGLAKDLINWLLTVAGAGNSLKGRFERG